MNNFALVFFRLIFISIILVSCGNNKEDSQVGDSGQKNKNPNVLFIAIDDLRTELNCYGAPVKSPNIDNLAKQGVLFDRHYVQFAVCIPSRVSLLTGLRPERTHQMYGPPVWEETPGAQSWGNTFREAGYTTVSLGKIWHLHNSSYTNSDKFDVKWRPDTKYTYANPQNQQIWVNFRKQRGLGVPVSDISELSPITEGEDVHDSTYTDGKVAQRAVSEMRKLAKGGKPFMMAVGFVKPHIPFCAPKKYWDMYDGDEVELPPGPHFPENMPEIAFSGHPNFFNYTYGDYSPLEKGKPMDDRAARHIRHAYRAAVSYIDAQVGLLLQELKRLNLDSNTIVVLWSDHGFHLGDVGHWGKQTNFEHAVRSPFIIKVPWVGNKNIKSKALVETVDIFPSLLELCNIPQAPVHDGKSIVPLLKDTDTPWKNAIFHVFNRNPVIDGKRTLIIGYAVRTDKYRFISWRRGWGFRGDEYAAELYDYSEDQFEKVNVADDPGYAAIRKDLEKLLAEGPPGRFKDGLTVD